MTTEPGLPTAWRGVRAGRRRGGASGLRVAGPAAGLEGRRGQSLVEVMAELRLLEGHSQTPLGQWEQAPGRGTGQARRGQIIGVPCVTAALSRLGGGRAAGRGRGAGANIVGNRAESCWSSEHVQHRTASFCSDSCRPGAGHSPPVFLWPANWCLWSCRSGSPRGSKNARRLVGSAAENPHVASCRRANETSSQQPPPRDPAALLPSPPTSCHPPAAAGGAAERTVHGTGESCWPASG